MKDCIFCKIIAGELPSYKIYEDERSFAFLDINPVHDGHTLVIPKTHAQNIFDISPEDWTAVQETIRRLAPAIERSLSADGINIQMNNREHAGQVVDHAHVHLIPRFKGDGLNLWPHHPIKEEIAKTLAEKIRTAV